MSYNYILSPTGETLTLDVSYASIYLEYAWSEDGAEIQCESIDAAVNTKVFDGSTTLQEASSLQVRFIVQNSQVREIMFLYAA